MIKFKHKRKTKERMIKMEEKNSWNLQDIFENEEQFKKEKDEIIKKLEEIAKYQGILCDTSDNLFNCYKLYEQALEKFEKVYAYGMLTYHLDMSNQEGIKIFKEVENLGTEFSVKTSFITLSEFSASLVLFKMVSIERDIFVLLLIYCLSSFCNTSTPSHTRFMFSFSRETVC